MPDGFMLMRKGERRPVYVQETAVTGTLTIQSAPAPTATLFNANGAAMSGYTALTAGFDAGALAAPRVWVNLDTAGLAPGCYTLVFTFTALSSDGLSSIFSSAVEVQVQSPTD